MTEAADHFAELSRTVVTKAVETVVEPIAEEGVKLAGEGIKLAGESVRLAGEGMKLAGEGMKLAGEGVKIAEGMLRRVLRTRRGRPPGPEGPPKDEPGKDEGKKE